MGLKRALCKIRMEHHGTLLAGNGRPFAARRIESAYTYTRRPPTPAARAARLLRLAYVVAAANSFVALKEAVPEIPQDVREALGQTALALTETL